MLRDYNLIKSLYEMLSGDENLTKNMGVEIHSSMPENNAKMPYILLSMTNSKAVHWSEKFQRIVCDFNIEIFSNYHGVKEIQKITERVCTILETMPLYANYKQEVESSDEAAGQDEEIATKTFNIRSGVNIIDVTFKSIKQGQKAEIKIKTMTTITPNNEPLDAIEENRDDEDMEGFDTYQIAS